VTDRRRTDWPRYVENIFDRGDCGCSKFQICSWIFTKWEFLASDIAFLDENFQARRRFSDSPKFRDGFWVCLIILCYVTLSKLHFSSVLLYYYVHLSHILLNTVCYCVLLCVTVLLWKMLRRVQSDVNELNWHGLVFDELTNGRAGWAYWSLVDASASVVTYHRCHIIGNAYCNLLLLAHWSFRSKLNHASSVQLRRSGSVFRFRAASVS